MVFLFSDLLNLPSNDTSHVCMTSLKNHLPNTPDEVLEFIYSDHGRYPEFQMQYKNIDLRKINWKKVDITATDLLKCSYYKKFGKWLDDVACRVEKFKYEEWKCIDIRPKIVDHWKINKTWQKAPYFISGDLINKSNKYHLVEGHTRTGALMGLVKHGIIDPKSLHTIWYGCST